MLYRNDRDKVVYEYPIKNYKYWYPINLTCMGKYTIQTYPYLFHCNLSYSSNTIMSKAVEHIYG